MCPGLFAALSAASAAVCSARDGRGSLQAAAAARAVPIVTIAVMRAYNAVHALRSSVLCGGAERSAAVRLIARAVLDDRISDAGQTIGDGDNGTVALLAAIEQTAGQQTQRVIAAPARVDHALRTLHEQPPQIGVAAFGNRS